MKKLISIVFFVLILPIYIYTQVITYTQIDPSRFPTVTTNFVLSDSSGETKVNVNPTDFEIYEQGNLIPNSTYTINCNSAPYKIILVLDQSTSMNEEVDGVRRWDMVIQGATNFINSLDLRNGSEIALETFGGESYWKCDFTSDKNRIIDSLNKVNPYGKTNFNVSFFGPNASSIDSLSSRQLGFKRIIVFLTDGVHNDDNDPIVKTDSILVACKTNNIQFFAIIFQAPMNSSLSYIASNSNGDDYVVASAEGLNKIYSVVANKIQNDFLCSLSWVSNVICDEIDRLKSVKIYYKPYKNTVNTTYIVPDYGIARIETDSITNKFDNPDIGSYYDLDINLTPKNSPTSILSMSIVPSTYFSIINYGEGQGVPPNYPINIPQDGQYKIKVRFTPAGVKTLRVANLQINATPCPGMTTLIGGIPEIFVDNPIKDEIFSACDTVNIKWSGVDPGTSVDLSFSDDQGNTWKSIAKNLTDNNYNWNPPAVGENLLVKAAVSPESTYIWAESGGGKAYDCAKSIAITPDNYYVYVAGFFDNTLYASDKFITSKGSSDAFLAKYDSDGNLQWIKSDGGALSDSAIYVAADVSGNAYYVGTCYSDATFGGLHPVMQVFNNQYLFIAKYSPSGQILGAFTLGARDSFPDFRAYGRSVSISGNTVTVVGQYTGYMKVGNFTFPRTTTLRNFTINLNLNLTVRNYSISGTFTPRTSVTDNKGYRYEIQNFTNYKNFEKFTVKSQGDYDFALTKFGLGSEAFDISDPFNVYYPNYIFTVPTLDVQSCLLGDTCQTNFTAVLHNNTKVPASISGFNFIFNPPADSCFRVDSSIIGKILQPDESIDIPISFSTIKLGTSTAQLQILGNCYENALVNLSGVGECLTDIVDTIYCGTVFVGSQGTIKVDTLIKNLNNIDLVIDPIIQGLNATDFGLHKISSDTIAKKSHYSVEIIFSPIVTGKRIARINLHMNKPCGDHTIYLIGEGINYQPLPPGEIDWKVRRINKSYDSTIAIYNPTKINYQITAIKFESQIANNEFSYVQPVNLPIILPPQDTTYFPISFLPTDEIQYSNTIIFTVGNAEGSNDMRVDLQGHGFYPQFKYDWNCGTIVKPLETTTASLRIVNTQEFSDLTISRIYLTSPDNTFKWSAGADPQNIVIPPHSQEIINIDFTPISASPSSGTIAILADDYDANFIDFWRETRFTITCSAFDVDNPPTLDFGTSLLCIPTTSQFAINNISPDTTLLLNLSQAQISGPDKNDFSLLSNSDILINNLDSTMIQLSFTPSHPGKHTAILTIPNSFNIPIKIQLVGYGEEISLIGIEKQYSLLPGQITDFTIQAIIPKLNQDISKIKMNIEYNHKVIQLNFSDVPQNLPNWQWKITPYPLDEYDLYEGNGIISTPFSGNIAEFKIMGILNKNKSADIKASIDYGCQTREIDLSHIEMSNVCMDSLIQIELLSNISFIEPPIPNPNDGSFDLKFGIKENSDVNISLYDVIGNKVAELINRNFKKGVYKYTFDVSMLPSGMYILVYSYGLNTTVEHLIIYK